METRKLLAFMAMAVFAAVGCGAPVDNDFDDEATDEVSARSWERFVGAWEGDEGPFHALVFTRSTEGRGRHYWGVVDTGIRCVRAPCPSTSRQEGIYTATTRTLTLAPSDPRLGVILPTTGPFQYTLRGEQLTLSRSGRVVARLHKVHSYCTEADDCAEQSLIAPRCLGSWSCTSANRCQYRCGVGGEGAPCGGLSPFRCADGLVCVPTSSATDGPGRCERRPPTPRCTTVLCAPGTRCEETPGGPRCVPNTNPCAAVRCGYGTRCIVVNGSARCVEPGATACGNNVCPNGQVCCNPLRGICTPPGHFCIQ